MPAPDAQDGRRWNLYLSGGGFRAALGAVGVLFYLSDSNAWIAVRRIVSVSGGGLTNAWLATHRPTSSELPVQLGSLFSRLTSRASVWLLVGVIGVTVVGLGAVVGLLALILGGSPLFWVLAILAILLFLVLFLQVGTRVWLNLLFRRFVGDDRLGGLDGEEWNREHIFVATDFEGAGPFFLLVNRLQAVAFSANRGLFDGREVSFAKTLRATTAFPPLLPPTRFAPKEVTDPRPLSDPRYREPVWKPRGAPRSMLLADGGITGNLGVQLDVGSPEGSDLLQTANAISRRGSAPLDADCVFHSGSLAWQCTECEQRTIVVDCSGQALARSRNTRWLLWLPLLGTLFHAVRTLKVMYQSHLALDAGGAGDDLVSTNRVEPLLKAKAKAKATAGVNGAASSNGQMVEAGWRLGQVDNLARFLIDPSGRRAFFTRLEWACVCARIDSGAVRTNLWSTTKLRAMITVASGYLNTCLALEDEDTFQTVATAMRNLDDSLRGRGELVRWWQGIGEQYEGSGEQVLPARSRALSRIEAKRDDVLKRLAALDPLA